MYPPQHQQVFPLQLNYNPHAQPSPQATASNYPPPIAPSRPVYHNHHSPATPKNASTVGMYRRQLYNVYQNQIAPQRFVAPTGMKVKHNARGVAYLAPKDEKAQKEAEEEYANKRLGVCASLARIEEEYGMTLRLYFEFQYILALLNVIFFAIQLINFVWYLVTDTENIKVRASNASTFLGLLYASNYSPSLLWVWRVTNIASMVIMLLAGPAYYIFCTLLFSRKRLVDHEQRIEDDESDIIEENQDVSTVNRVLRVSLSYVLAVVVLLINMGLVVGLTIAQNYAVLTLSIIKQLGDATKISLPNHWVIIGFSVVVGIITAISNKIWGMLSQKLTSFERHATWSSYRNHETFKLILFNLLNLSVIGLTKGLFTNPCVLEIIGNQYFIQLIVDILVFNSIELIVPFVTYFVRSRFHNGNLDDIRPEFNISDEYLELIYRQTVIYYAMPAFPMITFIAIFSFTLEIITDKLRLLQLCKKPPRMSGSFKTLVSFFLLLSAILVLANVGSGAIYLLTGYYWCIGESTLYKCKVCPIFTEQCIRNGTSICFTRPS